MSTNRSTDTIKAASSPPSAVPLEIEADDDRWGARRWALCLRIAANLAAASIAWAVGGCSSIGPATVPRDRADYSTAISDSWKQQTLLNIVRVRYGDFPIFMEVAQVISGYAVTTSATAGLSAANFTSSSVGGPAAVGGSAAVGATYLDRPTIVYAPLTGTDFIKTLMSPVPPSAVLFLLQSGYAATVVLPLTVDSINGVANESRRAGLSRPVSPEFVRLTQLLYELQQANALQIRIDRGKDKTETSVIGFPPVNVAPVVALKIAEVGRILHITNLGQTHQVLYGGWSGKGDEIAMTTRSMLQLMQEIGILAQIPEADIAGGKATPGASSIPSSTTERLPLLNIESGSAPPAEAYAAVRYKGHWFWIADNDVRSKSIFTGVMLLFSISDVGVRTPPPVVTIPAQ
jgi:hypothetical protein